jgi:hypothetical protein
MTDKSNFECADSKEHVFVVKKAKLAKLELLDGAEDKFLAADASQFVNLERAQKWVDNSSVKSLGRLGFKPKVYVEFDLPGVSEFKLKAVPDAKNIGYSDDEKGRNANFKFLEEEKTYKTESDGKLVISDAVLSVGGESSFHFECTDLQGNTLKSKKLTTQRKIFLQEMKMKGDAGKSAAASVGTVEGEFKKQGFVIETLARQEMPAMENIGYGDSGAYIDLVRDAYKTSDGKKKEPHTLVVGYTSHLAVKTEGRELSKVNVKVGPGESDVVINIAGPGKKNPKVKSKYLWQEIVTGEGWFESAYFKDASTNMVTEISEGSCTAVAVNSANPFMSRKVKIDVTKLPAGKTGKIVIKITWIDRMRAGLSFTSNNLICVCTKAWWQTNSAAEQNQVIIHEMGHKIGMTPDGEGNKPDKITTFYGDDQGHVGSHCHHGIPAGQTRYDATEDAALSDCVMYGSTNGHAAFCEHCAKAAKKQDVNAGWPTV